MPGEDHTNYNNMASGSFDSGDYNRELSIGDDSQHGTKGNQADTKQKHVSRPLASMNKTPTFVTHVACGEQLHREVGGALTCLPRRLTKAKPCSQGQQYFLPFKTSSLEFVGARQRRT